MGKITFLGLLCLVLSASTSFAFTDSCASVTPLQKQYHCLRYATAVCNGDNLTLDYKEVAAIVFDRSGMFKKTHFPGNADVPVGHYWVILKNGTKIFAGSPIPDNAAIYKWGYYTEFLKNHPEFSATQ